MNSLSFQVLVLLSQHRAVALTENEKKKAKKTGLENGKSMAATH